MTNDNIEGSGWVYKKGRLFLVRFLISSLVVLLSPHSVNFFFFEGVVSRRSECQK